MPRSERTEALDLVMKELRHPQGRAAAEWEPTPIAGSLCLGTNVYALLNVSRMRSLGPS